MLAQATCLLIDTLRFLPPQRLFAFATSLEEHPLGGERWPPTVRANVGLRWWRRVSQQRHGPWRPTSTGAVSLSLRDAATAHSREPSVH